MITTERNGIEQHHIVTFIYQPCSGDRVFAESYPDDKATPEVVKHPNGCRHVIGGAHLWWDTVVPTKWWRTQAKVLADKLLQQWGGVAWDDQGTIHIVTCEPSKVCAAMDAAARAFGASTCAEEALWAAVANDHAWIHWDGYVVLHSSGLADYPAEEDTLELAKSLAPSWY